MHTCRLRVCKVPNSAGSRRPSPEAFARERRPGRLARRRGWLSCGRGLRVRFPPLADGSHGEEEGTGGESAFKI